MHWKLGVIAILLSVVYVSLDLANFKLLAPKLYGAFYTKGVTNYYAAALIYTLYPVAVMVLTKDFNLRRAVFKAAVLGATGYGLYHLTNMATMDKWPVDIALYDTAWGIVVTMIMASIYHAWTKKQK